MTTISEHTAVWGKTLVDDLRRRGFTAAQIVGNTGLRLGVLDQEEPRISFDLLARLFERAAEITGDDLIGFRHGQGRDYRRAGLIAYVGMSSPTVRTLLQNFSRYQRITSDVIEVDAARLEEGVLSWHFQAPRNVSRRQYVEFGAAGTIDILRKLTSTPLSPAKVEFRHYRKTGTREISQFFGCPVTFGADANRFTLKRETLELPLQTADDHLFRIVRRFCEETLAKTKMSKPHLIASVEEKIAQHPDPKQESIARALGMSTRTLSRRLAAEGTSYQAVLEGYREAMAKGMIEGSDMSLTEIAFVLGYSDPGSFSTAFRRWVGVTPTMYRDRHR